MGTMIKIWEEPNWRTMWGPCFGLKRAIFWPFLKKGTTGYTWQCEIWHGTSLGILIKIQVEPILRTRWRPCFGHDGLDHVWTMFCHKRAMFWPFLGRGATGKTQQCEIWRVTSLGTMIKIQEEPIWKTMWGPCFGHKSHILAISRKGSYRINPTMWTLALSIPSYKD